MSKLQGLDDGFVNGCGLKSRILVGIFLFLFAVAASSTAKTERKIPWQYYCQQSLAAYGKRNYSSFLENSRKAVDSGPEDHPTLFYNLARAYSLTGNKTEAVQWLEKTLDLGFGAEALAGEDFLFLRDSSVHAELKKRIEAIRKPKIMSRTAVTLAEPDLIPESVAYDAAKKTFLGANLYKQKIVKIDARGKADDFVPETGDGLGAVVGIKVDPARRTLWVLSYVAREMKNFDKTLEGTGKLHKYDLKSGKLLKKYELFNKSRPHRLNDLVITASGDLNITDSLSSVVHMLRLEMDSLEVFAELAPNTYPNGIALSPDERKMYVANLNGISIIQTKTGKVSPLARAENIALAGIDGLYYYEKSLVAIQNFESPNRPVRLHLNHAGDRAEGAIVLESNHSLYEIPRTGVLNRQKFYYVANSQLRSFDENGKIFPLEKLQNPTILNLDLRKL